MKNIAIIPARSGSKGIKDKNIINVCGKPLIDYTIKAALESECFDTVMVSTDSEQYADISRNCGAEVPFLRSEFTSSDTAGTWDAVREVLQNYKTLGKSFDCVAVLQPTSPLRSVEDIRGAYEMLLDNKVGNVVTVTETAHPVQWCFPLSKGNSLADYAASAYNQMRRQDLEKHYQENGAIYFVKADRILEPDYNLYQDDCYAYIMPRERSIDIDEKIDLLLVETIIQNKENMEKTREHIWKN